MSQQKKIPSVHSSILFPGIFFICALLSFQAYSQKKTQLTVHGLPKSQKYLPAKVDSIAQVSDLLSRIQQKHFNNGYLAFSVDSVKTDSNQVHLYIHRGERYFIGTISINDSMVRLQKKEKKNSLASIKNLKKIEKNTLEYYQNRGFPFARFEKTTLLKNQFIHINFDMDTGKSYIFDSIQLLGPQLVTKNYLHLLTGIKPNGNYSLQLTEELSERINQTGFMTVDSIAIQFSDAKAGIHIRLKNLQQNSFSGIIGLRTNKNQQTEITGEVNLNLINTFKKGELLQLNWQKFAAQSQDLVSQFELPYLFNSPIGLVAEIKLYKQDSSFANTDLLGGLQVPLTKYSTLGITLHKNSSSAGSYATSTFSSSENLLYGLKYTFQKTDNPGFTTKGFLYQLHIETGNKSNLKESQKAYKSLSTTGTQQIISYCSVPLGALAIKNQSAFLVNDSIFLNNLFRLGGSSSFRGFNEKSIYSKAFSFFSLEYRIKIGAQSYVYLFTDMGWFSEPHLNGYQTVFREAYGTGLQLETKAGIVSLAYAIGKTNQETLNISQAKIHIGYTNRF